jgi:hypothetical protein
MSHPDEENRWAVYPIEKLEAAMKELSDAIRMAREVQRKQSDAEVEIELDKLLCPGCHDGLYLDEGGTHIYLDGGNIEPCLATSERKRKLKEYFAKNHTVPR